MFLSDSNVWIALALQQHVHHDDARAWLDGESAADSVLFCRATQQTLLRLLTTTTVFARHGLQPLTNSEAWRVYDAFVADDRIAMHDREPLGLVDHWRRFARRDSASPKLWMDSYLAAFAAAGGWQLVTTDRAFRQFDGLDLVVLG